MNKLTAIFLLICSVGCNQTLEPKSHTQPSEDILDGITHNNATTCELHNVPLQIGYAPINYGLPVNLTARQKLRSDRFPHAADPVEAGCAVGPWKKARVKVCYQCQSAYLTWKKTEIINQSVE